MVFSSLTFLFLFLPAVLLFYYLAPQQLRNGILFLFSLLFYAWGEPVYVFLMLFSTGLDYGCGRLVEKHRGAPGQRIGLILSVCINLGLLCFFKYMDFFIAGMNHLLGTEWESLHLPLPVGISFYTFQTMSYTIDVYRGEAKMQRNILSFGAYVSLFPQLIAGPIVRYQDVANQLNERTHSFDKFGDGARRFIAGLAKKVLLANNIGLLWKTISESDPSSLSIAGAWLGLAAFSFQIYFDFSGYSDMAIGLGKMLGFEFRENFKYPYMATSITEFWRRWHISLGSWFRDYVYVPLGGSRGGLLRQIRNIALIWLLTGLWHGASWNFVLWGMYFGLLLIGEKLFLLKWLQKCPVWLRRLYTLGAVLLSWVLFAFDKLTAGLAYGRALFGGGAGWGNSDVLYLLYSFGPLLLLCLIASTPWMKKLYAKMQAGVCQRWMTVADALGLLGLAGLSLTYLISGSYNPFLYFRF